MEINATASTLVVAFSPTISYITIYTAATLSLAFGFYNFYKTLNIKLLPWDKQESEGTVEDMEKISMLIESGAKQFLYKELSYISIFIALFALIIFFTVEENLPQLWTTSAFLAGAIASIIPAYLGMIVAVKANVRTSYNCKTSLQKGFITAFDAGSVLGFCSVGFGVMILIIIISIYLCFYLPANPSQTNYISMLECIAGYGLGGSMIALFGRVAGGIYTKAADVGADLVGKVENDFAEDSPDNPATIADNVGDNVGDIAGMGSDLFGSFSGAICACLVISGTSPELISHTTTLLFPLLISSSGIIVSIITTFFAHIMRIDESVDNSIETVMKYQLIISTVLMTPMLYFICYIALPYEFHIGNEPDIIVVKYYYCFISTAAGLWTGLIIGLVTDYYTSYSYDPVLELVKECETGPAMNLISGFALGFLSTIIPCLCIAVTIFVAYYLSGMYGIALSSLGLLSTMGIELTIGGYGPISDNAGGITEMAKIGNEVRDKTDKLDAAGNTTSAIGKGYAIGSASLVSLALFGAFVTRAHLNAVDIIAPLEFCGLLIGAMLPYSFSSMTMKSVGRAANMMVLEVRRQIACIKKAKENSKIIPPDYNRCIAISTEASLQEMIAPGCLVIFTPLTIGFLFGPKGVAGILAGALVTGMQLAISAANSGGAWDNAKKKIEKDDQKHSYKHKSAVIGDTVGDPLKDTSGPALNILIKLMAALSLVFGGFFEKTQIVNKMINL